MMKAKKTFQPLTSANICEIYKLLHKEGYVSFPLTSSAREKVDALVANINGASFGEPHYSSLEEKVTAYLFFLIKNHPFTDGNKRTASLCFLTLCHMNDLLPNLIDFPLDELVVFLEKSSGSHQEIIQRIASKLFFG